MKAKYCKAIRRQIEEADLGHELSSVAASHVRDCSSCLEFYETGMKLRRVVASLAPVEAPADFDFRLRARLANERIHSKSRFGFAHMSLALPSVAVATFVLLAGSVFVWRSLQNSKPVSAFIARTNKTNAAGSTVDKTTEIVPDAAQNALSKTAQANNPTPRKLLPKLSLPKAKREFVASYRRSNMVSKDFSNTGATVVRREESVAGVQLPISLPVQTLKVSLDDGSGISRTISFPTVSFGSERVLTRAGSTSQSAAKSDW